MADMKAPPIPSGIEDGIVILTKDALEAFCEETFAAGVARGRFEAASDQPYHYTVQGHGIVDAVCDVMSQGYRYGEGDVWRTVQERWEAFENARLINAR